MEDIYIVSGVRTAIGKYGGSLKSVPAHTRKLCGGPKQIRNGWTR